MSNVPPRPVAKGSRAPVPPRPVTLLKVANPEHADKVVWRWLMGGDRKVPIVPVRRVEAHEASLWSWMFQCDGSGNYVRATRVMNVIRKRAKDRSRAGFKDSPAAEAMNELWQAIGSPGGIRV